MVEQLALLPSNSSRDKQHDNSTLRVPPPYHLYLLVRNRAKLQWPPGFLDQAEAAGSQITLVDGDLIAIHHQAELLSQMDAVIHLAAAWGDEQLAYTVNVSKTLELFNYLDPDRCQRILYFSTASLLDQYNQPVEIAGEHGTAYIRTKYDMLMKRDSFPLQDRLVTLYPTLLFGGSPHHPYSHITAGLHEVTQWLSVVRFLKVDASFHFIHAEDIAQIVAYLLEYPTLESDWVLGNPAMTFNQSVTEMCSYYQKRIYFRLPVPIRFLRGIAFILNIKLSPWDDYCLQHRHFVHNTVNAHTFGLSSRFISLDQILSRYT